MRTINDRKSNTIYLRVALVSFYIDISVVYFVFRNYNTNDVSNGNNHLVQSFTLRVYV